MFLQFLFTFLLFLSFLAGLCLAVVAWMTQLLPMRLLLLLLAVLLFIPLALALMYRANRRRPSGKVIRAVGSLVLTLLCLVEAPALYYLGIANRTLNTLLGGRTQVTVMGVYVRESDPAQSIQDTAGYLFGVVPSLDGEQLSQAQEEVEALCGSLSTRDYASALEVLQALSSGQVDAILINSAYPDLLAAAESTDFSGSIRRIYAAEIETSIANSGASLLPWRRSSNSFCLYVSGIDTAGPVSTMSRSDVNILCVVNPDTKSVLLVSTPRDYYVPFPNTDGRRDKLTHAGIFGVDTSMAVLSELYGISVDYYLRMNFSGFEAIIDKLGGVDVESDASFYAGGYYFSAGTNHLSGAEALAFARERSSFGDGDRARGRHQMAVIRGVIQGMTSSQMLLNYTGVMSELADSFQTNMPKELLGDMVKKTLESGSWNVLSYSVDGWDSHDWCYAVGASAYVMQPYEDTVAYAADLMDQVRQSKTLGQEKINANAPQH